MPVNKIRTLVTVIYSLLFFHGTISYCQGTTREERTVRGKKVFICTWGHDPSVKDTFATAEEGCKHWNQFHLPQGFKYVSSATNEIGAVRCICKNGDNENDQQGQIMGITLCPELSVVIDDGTPYPKQKCECPDKILPPYYIGVFDKCELDTCTITDMPADQLQQWATHRLQTIVDEENLAFSKNTARVYDPKVVGQDSLFSAKEIGYFGNKFGWRKTPGTQNEKYSDAAWAVIYGHAIERLAGVRMEKDMCLKKVLQYIANADQMKDGGQPDFKGKGKIGSASYDITTPEQAAEKAKTDKKKDWIFITYTRLIVLDENGNNRPAPPKTIKRQ